MSIGTMQQPATVVLRPASAQDFERLLALRIRAMRESLERIGRFEPERARQRFLDGFDPEQMQLAYVNDVFVGCVTVRCGPQSSSWIEHLYIEPEFQGCGFGGLIMAQVLNAADAQERTFRLAVLRESDANRFYVRHGFVETHREEWDIYYERAPGNASPGSAT